MRRATLAVFSLMLLISLGCSIAMAAPPHVNYGEADYDPTALISYFSDEASLSADVLFALSDESFAEAQTSLDALERHVSPVTTTSRGISSASLTLPLSTYFSASSAISSSLQETAGLQETAATNLELLESAEDPLVHPDALVETREALSLIEGFIDEMRVSVQKLGSLGVETSRLESSLDTFVGLMASYEERYEAFREIAESDFTVFVLRVYGPTSAQDSTLGLRGMFYVKGEPVTTHPVSLYENDSLIETVATNDRGAFSLDYEVPSNLERSALSFHAITSHDGVEYRTDTVIVDLRIDTSLSLQRAYEIDGDAVSITFRGRLRDAFWSGIATQPLSLHVNDATYDLTSSGDGTYVHVVELPFEEGMKVQAFTEYAPPPDSAYAPSRSPDLVFYIRSAPPLFDLTMPARFGATLEYLRENLIYVISVVLAIMVVSALAVGIRRRRRPAPVAKQPQGEDEESSVQTEKEQTFEQELSLLEQLGGLREAVVAGYGAFIDFIERQGIVTLDRKMTHRDIDRRLRQIPLTRDESPTITHTFEVSRYSNMPVDSDRTSRFFNALHRIAARFGGDPR